MSKKQKEDKCFSDQGDEPVAADFMGENEDLPTCFEGFSVEINYQRPRLELCVHVPETASEVKIRKAWTNMIGPWRERLNVFNEKRFGRRLPENWPPFLRDHETYHKEIMDLEGKIAADIGNAEDSDPKFCASRLNELFQKILKRPLPSYADIAETANKEIMIALTHFCHNPPMGTNARNSERKAIAKFMALFGVEDPETWIDEATKGKEIFTVAKKRKEKLRLRGPVSAEGVRRVLHNHRRKK